MPKPVNRPEARPQTVSNPTGVNWESFDWKEVSDQGMQEIGQTVLQGRQSGIATLVGRIANQMRTFSATWPSYEQAFPDPGNRVEYFGQRLLGLLWERPGTTHIITVSDEEGHKVEVSPTILDSNAAAHAPKGQTAESFEQFQFADLERFKEQIARLITTQDLQGVLEIGAEQSFLIVKPAETGYAYGPLDAFVARTLLGDQGIEIGKPLSYEYVLKELDMLLMTGKDKEWYGSPASRFAHLLAHIGGKYGVRIFICTYQTSERKHLVDDKPVLVQRYTQFSGRRRRTRQTPAASKPAAA